MLIRQALFQGTIHPGREAEFRDYIDQKLLPLWRCYPKVREIRVLYEKDRDEGLPNVPMMLLMIFASQTDLATALASPIRLKSREVTKGLFTMFEGYVQHYVFEISHVEIGRA